MSQIRTLDALSFMQSKETPDQMKLISICKLIWWQVVSVKMHTSSFTQFVYVTVAFFVSIKTVLPTVCVFVQGALVRTRLGFLWACLRFFFGSCSWRSICSKRPLGPLPSTHSYTHPHIHTHTHSYARETVALLKKLKSTRRFLLLTDTQAWPNGLVCVADVNNWELPGGGQVEGLVLVLWLL